jgi:hypothetical protein
MVRVSRDDLLKVIGAADAHPPIFAKGSCEIHLSIMRAVVCEFPRPFHGDRVAIPSRSIFGL